MASDRDKHRERWLRRTTGTRAGRGTAMRSETGRPGETDSEERLEQVGDFGREARRYRRYPGMRNSDREALESSVLFTVVIVGGRLGHHAGSPLICLAYISARGRTSSLEE